MLNVAEGEAWPYDGWIKVESKTNETRSIKVATTERSFTDNVNDEKATDETVRESNATKINHCNCNEQRVTNQRLNWNLDEID